MVQYNMHPSNSLSKEGQYQPTHGLRNVLDKSNNTRLRRVTGKTSTLVEKPDTAGMGSFMFATAPKVYSGNNK